MGFFAAKGFSKWAISSLFSARKLTDQRMARISFFSLSSLLHIYNVYTSCNTDRIFKIVRLTNFTDPLSVVKFVQINLRLMLFKHNILE